MAIPQSFIQELLARTDVVDIVGRHVQLKKTGANFSGLCPFHSEKSPSFSVSPSKQFYHCFGCGKNGNAIGFLMDHLGMGFVEAVTDLAQQYGLQVPQEDISPQDRARAQAAREKHQTLSDVLEKACTAYKAQLKSSPKAVAYFKGRGVSGAVAARYHLGYAPEGWRSLASVFADYQDPLLAESGLVIVGDGDDSDKRYDRFRDRVMFPIRSVKGECIGFGGRVLGDDKPKYLNSPETPVFSKGRELYGLFEARAALREHGYCLVTEGYMDVVALAQLGFPNAVATLGTACTTDHVQKLFRFTDAVVFSFDGDAAGRRAARKALDGALPYASDVRSVKFLFLPPEHDPDSFIREYGTDAFAQCVRDAVPLSRFLLEVAREDCDLDSAEGRAHFAANARPLWTALPEGALKHQLLGEIAQTVQLETRDLSGLWAVHAGQHRAEPPRSPGGPSPTRSKPASRPALPARRRFGPLSREDRAVRMLLSAPQAWDTLSQEDQVTLAHLPSPHGSFFVWFEGQLHEHGPQPWAALRVALHGLADEDWVLALMNNHELDSPDADESARELRGVLNRLLVERLKAQESEAIADAANDPAALERYRRLQSRRLSLEQLI